MGMVEVHCEVEVELKLKLVAGAPCIKSPRCITPLLLVLLVLLLVEVVA